MPPAVIDATVEVRLSAKLRFYLDKLVRLEGYGETRQRVAELLVWDGINRLIESGRLVEPLKERGP